MERTLSPDAAQAIRTHMNDDHADAVAAYARDYANVDGVLAASIVALDARAMELAVETTSGALVTQIAFDHTLVDTDDARITLVAMARHPAPAE